MRIRRLIHDLIEDRAIADKMVLLAGPRQVGKTTAAKDWLSASHRGELYFNWDDEATRRRFRADANFFEAEARDAGRGARLVFDEIHKVANWKTLLKGYYDSFGRDFRFLVTGSARLELFHRAGDSMLGRYHLLHMAPLTPNEVGGRWTAPNQRLRIGQEEFGDTPLQQETIDALLAFSGFPEPFLKHSQRALNLWHQEYRQRLIREDLRDLTRISDFNRVEHLMELIPSRIGSPFSMESIRRDIGCSYDAVRTIVSALVKLCVVILVRPYSRNIKYALSKEPKLYLTDWTQVPDEGARFENFLAIQLKTFCEYVTDGGWRKLDLHYVRDKQKREADFLIVADGRPALLVEAKAGEAELDSNLKYFSERFPDASAVQVVRKPGVFAKKGSGIWVVSGSRFFKMLWGV